MKPEERTVDGILARLFITTLKIEEKVIASHSDVALTISELHVLREIGDETKTMSQVARGLKISEGALTTAANKLEAKGYVCRKRDLSDRRIVKICLTDVGTAALEFHENFHCAMVNAAISTLTTEEKDVLLKSLSKLDDYFIEEWEKIRA